MYIQPVRFASKIPLVFHDAKPTTPTVVNGERHVQAAANSLDALIANETAYNSDDPAAEAFLDSLGLTSFNRFIDSARTFLTDELRKKDVDFRKNPVAAVVRVASDKDDSSEDLYLLTGKDAAPTLAVRKKDADPDHDEDEVDELSRVDEERFEKLKPDAKALTIKTTFLIPPGPTSEFAAASRNIPEAVFTRFDLIDTPDAKPPEKAAAKPKTAAKPKPAAQPKAKKEAPSKDTPPPKGKKK